MSKKLILPIFAGVAGFVWLWLSRGEKPAPLSAPVKTIAKPQAEVVPATKPTVTNIPGIGPVPTDPMELEKFKAKAKSELRESLRKTGIFFDRADHKQAQDSGEMAWIFIEQRKNFGQALKHIQDSAVEPYQPRTLAALEHLLKHGEEAQLKLTAATLLYRYDQPAGKQYLLSVLNLPTVDLLTRDVVLALARNKETEAIPDIVRTWSNLGSPSDAILTTVARWRDPSMVQMLREQYRSDPRNWGYALALSQAGDEAAVQSLSTALKARGNKPSELTIQAGLAHLGAIESIAWAATMESSFQNRARIGERALVTLLDISGPSVSRGVAQTLLQACIPLHEEFLAGLELQAQGVRERNPALANKFPKEPPTAFIKGAAQLLAEWEAKEAVPTLQQVLTTVQKGNRADVYVNEALGLALYKLDPANWRDTLLNAGVPEYHVDRIPALAKLRPIPPEYLPKQVNLKAR